MKLTVEMDPASVGGNKLTTEDGEIVEGVKSIKWHADAVDRPRVVVEFFAERMDLQLADPKNMADEPEPGD